MRQLSDVGVYVTLDKDPTNDMIKKVNNRVQRAHEEGCISDSTLDYLLVNSTTKAGRFYLLPKLHKKGCPGRPVISGCNTPTEKISEFVDYHLKSLVASIPSFVKDTNDFLHKLTDSTHSQRVQLWCQSTWWDYTLTYLMMREAIRYALNG